MATDSRSLCHLCETRKPKRYCLGVSAEICTQCCGREREVSIRCPSQCVYLIEARHHERGTQIDSSMLPNKDIRVSEEFMQENQELFTVVAVSLITAAVRTPGTVDTDIRECLDAVIRTYR